MKFCTISSHSWIKSLALHEYRSYLDHPQNGQLFLPLPVACITKVLQYNLSLSYKPQLKSWDQNFLILKEAEML
jgi:hypothetical protein